MLWHQSATVLSDIWESPEFLTRSLGAVCVDFSYLESETSKLPLSMNSPFSWVHVIQDRWYGQISAKWELWSFQKRSGYFSELWLASHSDVSPLLDSSLGVQYVTVLTTPSSYCQRAREGGTFYRLWVWFQLLILPWWCDIIAYARLCSQFHGTYC